MPGEVRELSGSDKAGPLAERASLSQSDSALLQA